MDNRVYKMIRTDYDHFFRECPKVNSSVGKKSRVIKEELYEEFILKVLADERLDMDSRALLAILTSSGVRISEALALKVSQLDFSVNRIRNVIIQKKRNKDMRLDKALHPLAIGFLAKFIEGKPSEALLLPFDTRHQAYRRLNRYFGTTPHDFRHSIVNYFLMKQGQKNGLERITKLMGWSGLASAYNYSQNADLDRELDNFFKEAA